MTYIAHAIDRLGWSVGRGLSVNAISHWSVTKAGGRGAHLLLEELPASHFQLILLLRLSAGRKHGQNTKQKSLSQQTCHPKKLISGMRWNINHTDVVVPFVYQCKQ